MNPQDLVDALNRLTAAVQALNAKQGQRRQRGRDGGPGVLRSIQHIRSLVRQGRYGQAIREGVRLGRRGGGRGMRAGLSAAGGVGGLGGMALAVVGAVEAFRKFKAHVEATTEAMVQAQQRLGQVSPSMAVVMARRQMQEILRDIQKGEALAESARELVEAEQRRKDALLPFEVAIDNFWNRAYAAGNDFLAGFFKGAKDFFGPLLPDDALKPDILAEAIQKEVNLEMARKDQARKRIEDLRQRVADQEKKQRGWVF